MTIKVLLVDDQTLVRAGFRSLLDRSEDMRVVGEASGGDEAVTMARALQPDVVLMDIRMPGMDGIEATQQITNAAGVSGPKVVVLTTFEVDEYVFNALRAGASGFLLKDVEPDALREAVRVAASGEALLSPSVTRRLIAEFVSQPGRDEPSPGRLQILTDREREIMALVARGMSNEQIADHLVVSAATVKTHVSRAMTKLRVHDRSQLVVLAYETGLVQPGSS